MLIMMRALTQAERELDRLKELGRDGTSVRRRTLSREVSESVHADTDERRHLGSIASQTKQIRRHLGGSTSLNGAEDCIQNQSREAADNVARKYGVRLLNRRTIKEMKP